MSWKRTSIVIAVLSLAVLLLLGSSLLDGPESVADQDPHADLDAVRGETAAAPPPGLREGDAQDAAAGRQLVAPAADGRAVRCRVFRGFDKSFPGARIRMELFTGSEPQGEAEQGATVVADSDGCALWSLPQTPADAPPAGEAMIRAVRASSADERVRGSAQTALVFADQTRDLELALHLFPLDHEIHGTVEDGQGHPIAGADVSIGIVGSKTRSDEQGRFSVWASSAFPDCRYAAIAEGYGCTRGNARLAGPGRTKLRIVLEPGYRIQGRVTDGEGQGLAGARVTADEMLGLSVLTDTHGDYEITNATRGSAKIRVSALLEGFATGSGTVVGSRTEGRCDIRLQRGGQVEGTVVGPLGSPLSGARVTADNTHPANPGHRALSRADGSFALRDLRAGKHSVLVDRKGFAPARAKATVTAGGTSDPITITLQPGRSVAGQVTDKAGRPAPNIEIAPKAGLRYFLGRAATTDSKGRYRLLDLPDTVNAVDLLGVGFVPLRSQRVVLGNEHADFRLTRTVQLRGRVLDARTGAAVQSFRIRVLSFKSPEPLTLGPTWGNQGVQFQTQDGTWSSAREQIPDGTEFRLEARAAGYAPTRLEMVLARPDMQPVVFRMAPGLTLDGHVLDRVSGQPAAGVEVELLRVEKRDEGAKRPMLLSSRTAPRHRAKADARGRFSLADLPAARFHALVRREGRLVHVEGPLTPGAAGLTIWLQPPVTLSGRLVDWQDRALPQARVLVRRVFESEEDRATRISSATTDAEGRFAIRDLIRGPHVLITSAVDSAGATVVFGQEMTLAIADEARGDLHPIGHGSLAGTVALPQGADRASVRITVQGPEGRRHHFSAKPKNGKFAFLGLPPGQCRISVTWRLQGRQRRLDHPVPMVLREGKPARVKLDATH